MPQSPQFVRQHLWQARLERFQTQSITVKEFCRREGVSVPSFYQWKKRLGQQQLAPDSRQPLSTPGFAAVLLTDQLAAPGPVLRLPGGASIQLTEHVRRECLVELLAACVQVTQSNMHSEDAR